MMFYVVDTHPLIWYLAEKLPKNVDEIFKASENGDCVIFVPTIVLAECYYLIEDKRIQLNFNDVLAKIEESSNFLIVPFNLDIIKMFSKINIKELHDKIIVSTARFLNATLITKDRKIRDSKIVETVWN